MTYSRKRREQKSLERRERAIAQETPVMEFPFDPGSLLIFGPNITTGVGITPAYADALKAAGQPVPPPVKCRLLIDTGADVSVLRHDIAQKAGLKLIGSNTPLAGVGVDTTGCTYMGRILFGVPWKAAPGAQHVIYVDTRIMSGNLSNPERLDGLIGRDVLNHFEMRYNGRTGLVTMRYLRPPALATIYGAFAARDPSTLPASQ